MEIDKQLIKGSLKTVVLELLSRRPMHGYEIASQIKTLTEGRFSITEGTLYPMLHSFQADQFVESSMEETSSGRKRKVYKITSKGKKILSQKKKEWVDFSSLMDGFINPQIKFIS